MKVNVEVSEEYFPPYAVIFTDAVTDEIQKIIDILATDNSPIIAQQEDRMVVIKPEEVYMVRVEGGNTVIYTEKSKYYSRKRLYELIEQLGAGFMRISKQTVINLSCIQSVEAGFSGTLILRLNNNISDYVSRKFLPELKKYLGI
ncbi:MAG TPA: LytTR family transcriptional regulator [Mogibacterium sp.]|nr:LytTR family transcriptional regulator [Mogibacterium sp.]